MPSDLLLALPLLCRLFKLTFPDVGTGKNVPRLPASISDGELGLAAYKPCGAEGVSKPVPKIKAEHQKDFNPFLIEVCPRHLKLRLMISASLKKFLILVVCNIVGRLSSLGVQSIGKRETEGIKRNSVCHVLV
ncbi:hypothetical protein J2X65_004599 [Ancylobacter sp. 3268]|uniref:hypothetical protein n=1 Tax=Ancylobacter sp. 3268 TaxID=2817752 RepID=UPI00285B30CD|nr:hypothetical protein [Ancylobacter sp. 3268]MDR6955220.1 hypothetical protein [Ancylobacter sp. 3268]